MKVSRLFFELKKSLKFNYNDEIIVYIKKIRLRRDIILLNIIQE